MSKNINGDLTRYVITRPLREALEFHGINETSMCAVYSEIAFDPEVKPSTRLRCVELLVKMLGLTASENIDITINTELAEAVGGLEKRLRARKKAEKFKEAQLRLTDANI